MANCMTLFSYCGMLVSLVTIASSSSMVIMLTEELGVLRRSCSCWLGRFYLYLYLYLCTKTKCAFYYAKPVLLACKSASFSTPQDFTTIGLLVCHYDF